MTNFASWLFGLFKSVFLAAWDFISDAFIFILSACLKAFVILFGSIPSACFMSASGGGSALGNYLAQIPSYIWYFASHLNLGGCFGILACAVTFILARKIATLFQW